MIKSITNFLIIFFIFQQLKSHISQNDQNGYNAFCDETLHLFLPEYISFGIIFCFLLPRMILISFQVFFMLPLHFWKISLKYNFLEFLKRDVSLFLKAVFLSLDFLTRFTNIRYVHLIFLFNGCQ